MENIKKIKFKLFICSLSFFIIYFGVAFSMLILTPKEKINYQSNYKVSEKKSKIRGVISNGMVCAEDEIGLGDSHEGIMVLEKNVKPGTPVSEIFNIQSDKILEIGLTPNRCDAMSHYGVARDL